MKKIEILLKTIDKKKVSFLLTLTVIFSSVINLLTKQKLENGYEFFLSFLSVLLNASTFIFFMLVVISQEERKPKDPFYLFRYVSYLFLLLLAIAPFIYLWSMQDVIMHLNWQKPFSR